MPSGQLKSREVKFPKSKEAYLQNVGEKAADWPWANDLNNGIDGPVLILSATANVFVKELAKNLDGTLGITLIAVNSAGSSIYQNGLRRSFYMTGLVPSGNEVELWYTIGVRDTVNISGVSCFKSSVRSPNYDDGTSGIYWMYLKTAE